LPSFEWRGGRDFDLCAFAIVCARASNRARICFACVCICACETRAVRRSRVCVSVNTNICSFLYMPDCTCRGSLASRRPSSCGLGRRSSCLPCRPTSGTSPPLHSLAHPPIPDPLDGVRLSHLAHCCIRVILRTQFLARNRVLGFGCCRPLSPSWAGAG
jgi:hypothetical protein